VRTANLPKRRRSDVLYYRLVGFSPDPESIMSLVSKVSEASDLAAVQPVEYLCRRFLDDAGSSCLQLQ
jgi:hypothetical protein